MANLLPLFFLIFLSSCGGSSEHDLFAFKNSDGDWGYLNSEGDIIINNQFEEAYVFLEHIIKFSSDNEIKSLAKYRKAKLLIEEERYEEAHLLIGEEPDNYQHIELKGDLYLIQDQYLEAINHYNDVLTYSITPNERKNIIAKINLIK